MTFSEALAVSMRRTILHLYRSRILRYGPATHVAEDPEEA
jgi:hypothetical protein